MYINNPLYMDQIESISKCLCKNIYYKFALNPTNLL